MPDGQFAGAAIDREPNPVPGPLLERHRGYHPLSTVFRVKAAVLADREFRVADRQNDLLTAAQSGRPDRRFSAQVGPIRNGGGGINDDVRTWIKSLFARGIGAGEVGCDFFLDHAGPVRVRVGADDPNEPGVKILL